MLSREQAGHRVNQAMAQTGQAALRHLLLAGYEDLKRRLTRRLGCPDLAADALQDTFLRLERADSVGPVRSPQSYLFRMALNTAINHRVASNRRLTTADTEALLELPDDAPDPA